MIVFPNVVQIDPRLDEFPSGNGERATGRRGSGLDLLALRDYQPQDDPRSIDWKATARSRHLTVREYANEDDVRVSVILDPRVPRDEKARVSLRERLAAEQSGKPVVTSERFEAGASLAASLLSRLAAENAEFRLIIDTAEGELGRGLGHLHDSLKRLATVEPKLTDDTSTEPADDLDRILNETDEPHRILITACGTSGIGQSTIQTLKIIEF